MSKVQKLNTYIRHRVSVLHSNFGVNSSCVVGATALTQQNFSVSYPISLPTPYLLSLALIGGNTLCTSSTVIWASELQSHILKSRMTRIHFYEQIRHNFVRAPNLAILTRPAEEYGQASVAQRNVIIAYNYIPLCNGSLSIQLRKRSRETQIIARWLKLKLRFVWPALSLSLWLHVPRECDSEVRLRATYYRH